MSDAMKISFELSDISALELAVAEIAEKLHEKGGMALEAAVLDITANVLRQVHEAIDLQFQIEDSEVGEPG